MVNLSAHHFRPRPMKDHSVIIVRSQLCRSNVGEVARPHRVSSRLQPRRRPERPSGGLSGLPR
eukprot:829861-Prymnesium_polylepis.1